MNLVDSLLFVSILAVSVSAWLSSRSRIHPLISAAAVLVLAAVLIASSYTLLLPWHESSAWEPQVRKVLANSVVPVGVVLSPACMSRLVVQHSAIRKLPPSTRVALALAVGLLASAAVPLLLYVGSCGIGGECA